MDLFRRGKAPKADPAPAALHPDMQAHYDPSLPYWVASDHAVWGRFDNGNGLANSIALADRVAAQQPVGERVYVTLNGVSVYTATGSDQSKRLADRR